MRALGFVSVSMINDDIYLDTEHFRVTDCCHHDPFQVLGLRVDRGVTVLTLYRPDAEKIQVLFKKEIIDVPRIEGTDFFVLSGMRCSIPEPPQLLIVLKNGQSIRCRDPYSFQPVLSNEMLGDFGRRNVCDAYRILGARQIVHQGIQGVLFSVWAPNAERISVVGDFNQWDGRIHPMRCRGESGIWELFITDVPDRSYYKFEIRHRDTGKIYLKADPYGHCFARRPDTASLFICSQPITWQDQSWMTRRHQRSWLQEPMSIYEVHLGSWRAPGSRAFPDYRTLAHELVEYVQMMGFTHIELMPITEHPFDGSWGYQVTGYFAPTSRYGDPEDFRYFVDYCHRHDIGVLLDWVPAHFPKDEHGLSRFDGSCLYEHDDPKKGEHRDWGTLVFNYGRQEVKNFLLSSACYWLEEFHIDGLRVDAVASMLYLDYSKKPDEWIPNIYGGNENLDAMVFLRDLNVYIHEKFPGAVVMAEESTSWPGVSRPVHTGGLGFSMKWNMGWMNDTLRYFQRNTAHRPFHHEDLTFGLLYAFSENFILPFSHDEVVHGKGSILNKMPGDPWQRFANVRLLYTYLYTYPGKKLLFMGNEFAQGAEWNHDQSLEWHVLDHGFQRGIQTLVKELNQLYKSEAALYQRDFFSEGFRWINCHDHSQSVLCYMRQSSHDSVIVILNFTPTVRHDYRVGIPDAGIYSEIFNSDSEYFAGSNVTNGCHIVSELVPWMSQPNSFRLTLPPLGGLILKKISC